jgi:hypothetical protein
MEMQITEQNIRVILLDKMKNSIHAKVNKLNERIDTLLNIHRSWIAFAQFKQTYEQMAETLLKYDKNICKY